MTAQTLPTAWTLQLDGAPADVTVPAGVGDRAIPATVPGCVHTDLLAADLIPDPYLGLNEAETHWIGLCEWSYRTTFEVAAETLTEECVELAFDGLDTVATVLVNGQPVGEAANMHCRHRFDVRAALRAGANEVVVHFASPIHYARGLEEQLGELPYAGFGSNSPLPHNMIRKMSCNFGWDWGPQVVTSGIWRSARLEAWSMARIADVRPLVTRADTERAMIDLRVDAVGEATVVTRLFDPAGELIVEERSEDCRCQLEVAAPELLVAGRLRRPATLPAGGRTPGRRRDAARPARASDRPPNVEAHHDPRRRRDRGSRHR